jgi:hypothetical protein
MACKKVIRHVRKGGKPGLKTVPVKPYKRSKAGKC